MLKIKDNVDLKKLEKKVRIMTHYEIFASIFMVIGAIYGLCIKSVDYAIYAVLLAIYCLDLEILSRKDK